jgi:hypothetical protein
MRNQTVVIHFLAICLGGYGGNAASDSVFPLKLYETIDAARKRGTKK